MHLHMFWRKKYRQPTPPQPQFWHDIDEAKLMEEYINRRKDEDVLEYLQEMARTTSYECDDPRLHPRSEEECNRRTQKAKPRLENDFQMLTTVIDEVIQEKGHIPYAYICMLMAANFLGGGVVPKEDPEYPGRSSKQLSVMFWNLGNWCRTHFDKCPVPTQLEK